MTGEGMKINVLLDVLLTVAGNMMRAIVQEFDIDYYASEAASAAEEYA